MLPATTRLLPCLAATPQLLASLGQLSQGAFCSVTHTSSSSDCQTLDRRQWLPQPTAQPQLLHPWLSLCLAGSTAWNKVEQSAPQLIIWNQRWLHTQQQQQKQGYPTPASAPTQPSTTQDVESPWTPSNLLSIGRAVSAPWIAWLILQANWPWAVTATAISGLTDWADGALARRLGQSSVLGSYLDPAADKALVCCVVGALAAQGAAPMWVAGVIIGRDVALVGGMFLHRWRTLNWRVSGITPAQFFSVSQPGSAPGHTLPFMKPLMISKINTVLQLMLVCGCMSHAWLQLPDAHSLHYLELLTAGTTVASLGAYMWAYKTGRVLPMTAQTTTASKPDV